MAEPRAPKATGALTALLIALPLGLVLAWSQPTDGPSRAELAAALTQDGGAPVAARDIESLHCEKAASIGYECRWRQRVDDVWQQREDAFAIETEGWQLLPKTRDM